MPLLCNMSEVSLPSTTQLTPPEKRLLAQLQIRSSLGEFGFDPKMPTMKPLEEEEVEQLNELELRVNDQRMPRWGPVHMPMAPYGKQGCCWRVPYNLMSLPLTIHPKRLQQIEEESVPAGVIPLEPKYIPTIEEMTPVAISVGDGRNIAAAMGPKLGLANGRVVALEVGFASAVPDPELVNTAEAEFARLSK